MSLLATIKRQISQTGPMSLADYMALCLMHPKHGYYQKATVFGAEGDFVTAPEISQMFGEMIAAHVAERWNAMGQPDTVHLVELGPGRGTLMADVLRTTARVSGLESALHVHLVEASKQLRAEQANRVAGATWHDALADVPAGPAIIIANEFLDALPIHQFVYSGRDWQERRVTTEKGRITTGLGALSPAFALAMLPDEKPEPGDVLEVCPGAAHIVSLLKERAKTAPTSALFIDYGYSAPAFGDSLQAVRAHDYADPFENPGDADLTAHVNFAALADQAKRQGLSATLPVCQGDWLMAMGIGHRAMMLADGKPADVRASLLDDLKRLTAPDEMGELFKVLAVAGGGLGLPAVGFSPQSSQSGLS